MIVEVKANAMDKLQVSVRTNEAFAKPTSAGLLLRPVVIHHMEPDPCGESKQMSSTGLSIELFWGQVEQLYADLQYALVARDTMLAGREELDPRPKDETT